MDQLSLSHRYSFGIDALNSKSRADQIKELLKKDLEHAAGGQKIETDIENRILTILSSEPLDMVPMKVSLQPYGFHLHELKKEEDSESKIMKVCIDGMTCHSCEVIVERNWKKVEGVSKVEVSAANGRAKITYAGSAPSIAQLQNVLGEGKYIVNLNETGNKKTRPSIFQLVGLFALVLLL